MVRDSGGAVYMRIRRGICLVVGTAGVVGAERDIPTGNPICCAELERVCEHAFHIYSGAGVLDDAVPLEVRVVLVLRVLRGGDDGIGVLFLAGDEEYSDRGDGGGVEGALVLVQVHY